MLFSNTFVYKFEEHWFEFLELYFKETQKEAQYRVLMGQPIFRIFNCVGGINGFSSIENTFVKKKKKKKKKKK